MDGIGKDLAFSVFEVFMQNLIAANVIVPQLRGDALKVFIRVDLYGAIVLIILDKTVARENGQKVYVNSS